VAELLAATVEHFQKAGRWTEGNVAALAQACFNCQLYSDAVTYYNFAIKQHQRTAPNQGIGDGTLSSYYQQLAAAHAALHQTAEAVDAASSAIVSWGADYGSRQNAVHSLQNVLGQAQDLDQYVAAHDAKVEEFKQDSPILRKAIGNVYKERSNLAAAARNYELALELAPGDSEIYAALLQCYDQLERKEDAVGLVLAQIDVESHNLALYNDLARRLADDPARAERAATSIVEASPLEAENQQALAELRGTQDRWADAVRHWGRAAELRALEPSGLLGLADAQLRAGDKAAAQETLKKLQMKDWPARFDDLLNQKLPELRQRADAR
jgi:tetratricopeptide (TPR) repeat protein